MQKEKVIAKSKRRFRVFTILMIGMLMLSIFLPKQFVSANANDWQLELVGADQAHEDGYLGSGIKVGVIDNKFDGISHGDLVVAVVKHIAPATSILTYSVQGSLEKIDSRALANAIITAAKDGVHIINISLGTEEEDRYVKTAISQAVDAGIIVVASSGNNGNYLDETKVYYPAADERVIAVGAVDQRGEYLKESNYGQVKAPGEFVFKNQTYVGTSIAAPYVSGLIAIYMEQHDTKDVKSLLLNNVNEKNIVQYKRLVKGIDKALLEVTIEVAENLIKDEDYTEASKDAVVKALVDAKLVMKEEDVTQELVDDVTDNLIRAMNNLTVMEEELKEPTHADKEEPKSPESEETDPTEQEKPTPKEEEAALITIEVGQENPTPIQPQQVIQIGDENGGTILTPLDLPEGVSIVIEKVAEDDERLADAVDLTLAGDVYTIELIDIDPAEFQGSFVLTLNYEANTKGRPAIYYYDEIEEKWEKRGGIINEAAQTISLELADLSTYGVFVQAEADEKVPQKPQASKKEKEAGRSEKTAANLATDQEKPVTLSNDVATDEKTARGEKEQITMAKDEGSILPNTATPYYNYMAYGLFLIFSGIYFRIVFRPKKA